LTAHRSFGRGVPGVRVPVSRASRLRVPRAGLVALVGALAVLAVPATGRAANECAGIPRCISVSGPWVAVSSTGEAKFMLECPQSKGVVAGTDALATSVDIHASFDGILGSPVSYGRTTNSSAFFRAVSGFHRAGAFKPFIGCIPTPSSLRNTIAAKPSPIGPPLDLRATIARLVPGVIKTISVSCPKGEVLVDSWTATASTAAVAPAAELLSGIEVQAKVHGRSASASISASEALPATIGAEVQLGVRCAAQ